MLVKLNNGAVVDLLVVMETSGLTGVPVGVLLPPGITVGPLTSECDPFFVVLAFMVKGRVEGASCKFDVLLETVMFATVPGVVPLLATMFSVFDTVNAGLVLPVAVADGAPALERSEFLFSVKPVATVVCVTSDLLPTTRSVEAVKPPEELFPVVVEAKE